MNRQEAIDSLSRIIRLMHDADRARRAATACALRAEELMDDIRKRLLRENSAASIAAFDIWLYRIEYSTYSTSKFAEEIIEEPDDILENLSVIELRE